MLHVHVASSPWQGDEHVRVLLLCTAHSYHRSGNFHHKKFRRLPLMRIIKLTKYFLRCINGVSLYGRVAITTKIKPGENLTDKIFYRRKILDLRYVICSQPPAHLVKPTSASLPKHTLAIARACHYTCSLSRIIAQGQSFGMLRCTWSHGAIPSGRSTVKPNEESLHSWKWAILALPRLPSAHRLISHGYHVPGEEPLAIHPKLWNGGGVNLT